MNKEIIKNQECAFDVLAKFNKDLKNVIINTKEIEQKIPNFYYKVKNGDSLYHKIDSPNIFTTENDNLDCYLAEMNDMYSDYDSNNHYWVEITLNEKGYLNSFPTIGCYPDNIQRGVTLSIFNYADKAQNVNVDFAVRKYILTEVYPYAEMIKRLGDGDKWNMNDIERFLECDNSQKFINNTWNIMQIKCGGYWLFYLRTFKGVSLNNQKRNYNAESFARSYGYNGLRIYSKAIIVNKSEYED